MKRSFSSSVDSSVIQPSAACDNLIAQAALALQHLIDPLFERPHGDELVHLDILGLSHPISAVGRLILDRGVPPAVEVEHMVRRGQIQTYAAGLDGRIMTFRFALRAAGSGIGTARSCGRASASASRRSNTARAHPALDAAPAASSRPCRYTG